MSGFVAEPVHQTWELSFKVIGIPAGQADLLMTILADKVEEFLDDKAWVGGMHPIVEMGEEVDGPTDDELAAIAREYDGNDSLQTSE